MCDLEVSCAIKNNQKIISDAVRGILEQLTLADLIQPLKVMTVKDACGKFISTIDAAPGRIQ